VLVDENRCPVGFGDVIGGQHYPIIARQARPVVPDRSAPPRLVRPADGDSPRRPIHDGPAGRATADAWLHVPLPAEAIAALRQLHLDTGDRRALEGARCIASMLAARTRSEITGPPLCQWCGEVIKVTTRKGPRPRYCNDAHSQAAYRQRVRDRQAAESGRDGVELAIAAGVTRARRA